MSVHTPLAPSAAGTWRYCAGSVQMTALYLEAEDEPAALEEQAAHWVIEQQAHGLPVAQGDQAPNGDIVTDEMLEGADVWAEAIAQYVPATGTRHIEKPVGCGDIHEDCWGTPDLWHDSFVVADYKFGHGHVEVFENWQLLAYAVGVASLLADLKAYRRDVTLVIVQPRSYHRDGPIRSWTFPTADLAGYVAQLSEAAHAAMQPEALCTVGTYCRYCPARHACPTLAAAALTACDMSLASVPVELPTWAQALELRLLQRAQRALAARVTGLEEALLALGKSGQSIPGYRLEAGKGRTVWNRPVEEIVQLGALYEVDVAKPGAITPAQATKAGLPAELVAAYSITPTGEVKLVADDGSQARKVFSNHKE